MRKAVWLLISLLAICLATPGFAQTCTEDEDCLPRGPGFECNASSECVWVPPIGIPKPSFGIEETYRMYDEPANRNPDLDYTQNTEGGYYTHYVDCNHPAATDTDTPSGTASKPRKTIPGTLPGSVVEVHGGPYTTTNRGGYVGIMFNGTSDHPVFVRGIDEDNMPVIPFGIRAYGSYGILEYFDFDGGGFAFRGSHNFVALRHSEVHNALWYGVGILGDSSSSDVVVYNNNIHHRGVWDAPYENDTHAISCFTGGEKTWVVDNQLHHTGGDGIQVGGPKYLYIGRNEIHHNHENAVDVKMGSHVIFSQNTCYGYGPPTNPVGWVIRPNDEGAIDNFWIIFNEVYDSRVGIQAGGTTGPPYIIGNKFHDLVGATWDGIYRPSVAIDGVGAECIVNNVIYNVDRGIVHGSIPGGIANNIISNAAVDHILGRGGPADIYNILLWQNGEPVTIIGDSCIDCIEADPLFADAAGGDFHLLDGSPAIDKGIESDVYAEFERLYGIDIRVDFDGNPRPQGLGWDIGAFEAEEPVGCITTELLLGYIDQWEQGSRSMPYLMNRIAAWKSDEGC